MELLDIYGENGAKLGCTKSREEAHEKGLWHKIACVFVVNSKGEVILQKRSPLKLHNPNGWTCSASGHIDAGEDTLNGGLRELEEEIGVKATRDDLKYIGTVLEKHISDGLTYAHIADVYILNKDININNLKYQKEEVSGAMYFRIEDMENIDFSRKHAKLYKLLKENVK